MDSRQQHSGVLYVCFFVSGMAGLIYEVLWAKYLSLFIGSTAIAQIIVLATFMGGMALGSHVLGGWADRVASSLKFYSIIEVGIGLYALVLFEPTYRLGRFLFIAIARGNELSGGGLLAAKIVASAAIILVPSFLIGGTLPSLSRHLVRKVEGIGPKISRIYFLNSLGAVVGCILAGFYFIAEFGLQFTMIIGGLLNLLVGFAAWSVAASLPGARSADADPQSPAASRTSSPVAPALREAPSAPPWTAFALLACVAVSGAVSMMYEVAWIRLLTLVLGSSTYSFSLMLATFILGLSLGGLLLSLWRRPTGYRLIFGLSEVGVGLTVLLMLPFYARLPYIFNQIESSLARQRETFALFQLSKFALCSLVMIVPAILQGITLPAATKLLTPHTRGLGRRIGFIFAVNTVGTLVGVVFAGFWGLPLLGVKGTLELAVALNVVLGLVVLSTEVRKPRRNTSMRWAGACIGVAALGYILTMEAWDQNVFSAGVYRLRKRLPSYEHMRSELSKRNTIFYRDGIDATIAIQEIKYPKPDRLLVINGKVDASMSGDLPTQKGLGHLPMLIHPDPQDVLIVGMGTGAVIGATLAHEPSHIDVVEISRDVIETSRFFAPINGSFWERPAVDVHWEDAKTFLLTTDREYDVITSEPTNPWIAGVAGVFSDEFFRACRDRLRPGGLFVQWIQTYELEDMTFYMMLGAVTRVFPYYTIWNTYSADTIIVGSTQPYHPDLERMARRIAQPKVSADLAQTKIRSLLPILGMQMVNRSDRPGHVQWIDMVHSDFYPVLDYLAPRGFFIGERAKGAEWIDERKLSPLNSRLWINEYLEKFSPGAAELRASYAFSLIYSTHLHEKMPLTWATEWLARFPDDEEAKLAVSAQRGATHEFAMNGVPSSATKNAPWSFDASKLRCRLKFTDYQSTRTHLRMGEAEETLREIEAVIGDYPKIRDADLYTWSGELLFDLGRYGEATLQLARAATLHSERTRGDDEVISVASLLCKAHLRNGDPERAHQAYQIFLQPHETHLKAWLTKALIRDFTPDRTPGTDLASRNQD